jgi:hypothetical protein
MRKVALLALLATACSGGSSPFTLVSPAVSRGQGVDLASLTVVDEGRDNPDVDFFIQQAMVVSLRGQHDETFCEKGRKFTALSEIPTSTGDCPTGLGNVWSRVAYLGGSSVHAEGFATGYGFLVRTRDRARLFRMRVVGDTYDEKGTATATLEVAPVP